MTYTRTHVYQHERHFFYAALALLIVGIAGYMYFVSASVVHVVVRKEIDREIASFGSNVSQLESQYIEAQHLVSNDIATQHGFVRTTDTIYIDRTASTFALSKL